MPEPAFDPLDPSFPLLVRTARSILGWNQVELAKRAGISEPSVSRLERYEGTGRLSTLQKITKAFEEVGISFVQQGTDFGVMIAGTAATELRSSIRGQQAAEDLGSSMPVNKARVRKRKLKLEGPPELEKRERAVRRKLKIEK